MGASACNVTSPPASAGPLIALSPASLRGIRALQDVFQVDFVVMDEGGGAVDNNRGQDFRLPLVGALTEEGILQRQAAAMAQLEERRLQVGLPLPTSSLTLCPKCMAAHTVQRLRGDLTRLCCMQRAD